MKEDEPVLGYTILWVAALLILIWCLFGCVANVSGPAEQAPPVPAAPTLKVQRLSTNNVFADICYVEFQVDGCEYIHFYTGHGKTIHKPNCKNHVR
jgi:hypothetical protein